MATDWHSWTGIWCVSALARLVARGCKLADPAYANPVIRDGKTDLLMIGRPTLANPHWPYYAAMALGENAALQLTPD